MLKKIVLILKESWDAVSKSKLMSCCGGYCPPNDKAKDIFNEIKSKNSLKKRDGSIY
ncbi:MAG: hypothetical protein LBV16_07815 [Elusimicrobiota bacterium]|jgi:hypothetical protein|nr:hypothetical protein [Elusimicrobiota bacterium]